MDSNPASSLRSLLTTRRIRLLEGGMLVLVLLGIRWCTSGPDSPPETGGPPPAQPEPTGLITVQLPPPPPEAPRFTHPTPQREWRNTDSDAVYMPTGSGRVESASYGSVRTRGSGLASFHEGVDIAPVTWENGRAVDSVFAAGDGTIAYINSVAGNSSYGKYVVIAHPDAVGEVYTLYAHLASVRDGLQAGQSISRGTPIGVIGHTSTLGIPRQRSHLHFEMCLMLNPDFNRWFRSKKLTPEHGHFHGWNLAGLNPHALLEKLDGRDEVPFSYARALERIPAAWTLLVRDRRTPRYFIRYPSLWRGDAHQGGAYVLEVSESGIPLAGRNPTPQELAAAGSGRATVLEVNREALGRNGLRHVVKRGNSWTLDRNGERWLDILTYRP